MNATQRNIINSEILFLLQIHMDYIEKYGVKASIEQQLKLNLIVDKITYLTDLAQYHPSKITKVDIIRATEAIEAIEHFLQMTNAYPAFFTNAKELGKIYKEVRAWHTTAIKPWAISLPDVWGIIDPVQPDTIKDLSCNCFQAFWADPVPMMDIEILLRTPHINVLYDSISRHYRLKAGITVDFSMNPFDKENE